MRCGRALVEGKEIEGEVVKVEHYLSFLGEVDPKTGTLYDGRKIKDKVLIIRGTRGSTVGSYVIYALSYYNNKPLAIVVENEADPIVVAGCVMANIPLVDSVGEVVARDGDKVRLKFEDGKGCLEVLPSSKNF